MINFFEKEINAKQTIQDLAGDTSEDSDIVRSSLEELRDLIQEYIDGLE